MIRAILDDIQNTYTSTGGGGISRIVQKTTYSYEVSISQEEAPDVLLYEFEVDENCMVTIKNKKAL